MTSNTPSNQTLAFFGATGGCAHACLVHTLNDSYLVNALARTPSKMTEQLKASGVSQATVDTHLTIIQGNSKDLAAVKRTLCPNDDGNIVSKIIFGIGGTPKLTRNPLQPFTLDDPAICEDSIKTIIQALQELQSAHPAAAKPLISFVSTTGVNRPGKPRDVPLLFVFLYHVLLAVPHKDKHILEETVEQNVRGADQSKRVFQDFVGVRASLLSGGITASGGKGLGQIRTGTENQPAVGYFISRADVGEWLFHNIVRKDGKGWLGEMVTITT